MALHNVHERTIAAPVEVTGALLDRLGRDGDPLWPRRWLPMRLDRPLQVGADGGHGDVRYWVSEYEPGRRVRFEFHPETGIDGYHELIVEPAEGETCVVRHVLAGEASGVMRILTPLVVEPLHDAVLEDLLDNAEGAATGDVARPASWSRWVRFWRRTTEFPKPKAVPLPDGAHLAAQAFDAVDFADAWQAERLPATSDDPQEWANAIFADPPRGVAGLLRARDRLVALVGIEPSGKGAFATVARSDSEVLLGSNAGHLDFRASVLLDATTVTVTTVVSIHNRRGRQYMALVSRVHPLIVRRMLRRSLRSMDGRAVGGRRWAQPTPGQGATVASRSGAPALR